MTEPAEAPPPVDGEVDALWDAPIDEASFCFVDLEMTGLDREADRICEICLVRTRGNVEIGRLDSLVLPDVRVGENAGIHGLDADALASAPAFAALLPRVLELLEGAILVGHAVEHDAAFLEAEAARCGTALSLSLRLDTLPLSRRCLFLPSHRLEAVAQALEVPLARKHRATDDAEATRAVFFRLTHLLAARSPRDLNDVKIGQRRVREEILALCLAAEANRAPVVVRYRAARKAAEEAVMVITAVLTDLDPPRVMGYLALGRSRRELRADRILAVSPYLPSSESPS